MYFNSLSLSLTCSDRFKTFRGQLADRKIFEGGRATQQSRISQHFPAGDQSKLCFSSSQKHNFLSSHVWVSQKFFDLAEVFDYSPIVPLSSLSLSFSLSVTGKTVNYTIHCNIARTCLRYDRHMWWTETITQ